MTASYSLVASIVFLTTLAYSQYSPYFYNPYAPSQNRRVDEDQDTIYYQERAGDRAANERSIPYNSDAQSIQQERGRIRPEDLQLRNGNVSVFEGYVKNLPVTSNRRAEADSSHALKFPGPTNSPRNRFVPEIPDECQEMGLCAKVPNYPQDHVDQILAKHGNLTIFNMDLLTPDIVHRRGPEPQVEELCLYTESVIYPEAARNVDGEWVFIVNKKQFHVQGFKTEVCKQPNKPCEKIAIISKRYTHSCGQKYTKRTMWSLDQASGNMVMQVINTPSCCTCFVTPKNIL